MVKTPESKDHIFPEEGKAVPVPADPSFEEVLQAANVISRLPEGKPLAPALFAAIAERVTTPVIELVPYRIRDGQIEVLFIPRPADDPTWPGMIHVPGTAFRPSDTENGFEAPFVRLFRGELEGTDLQDCQYHGIDYHSSKRGSELAFVHSVQLDTEEPKVGTFIPVRELPANVVESQLAMIYSVADEITAAYNLELLPMNHARASFVQLPERAFRNKRLLKAS